MGDPWASDGAWLRHALRAHATRSRGELAPERSTRCCGRAGHDVLAVGFAAGEPEPVVVHARPDVPRRKAWPNPLPG